MKTIRPFFTKLTLSICICLLSTNAFSQGNGYIKCADGGNSGYLFKMIKTSGGYVTLGQSNNTGSNDITFWNSNFQPQWNKNFIGVVFNWIDVVETNDGNIVALAANNNHTGCVLAIKLNPSGTILWQNEYYVNNNFLTAFSLAKAAGNDPGFVFGGGACAASAYIIRCGAAGNIIWQHEYFITGYSGVETTWGIIAENSSYVLGGYAGSSTHGDVWFTKIDSGGNWLLSTVVTHSTLHQIPTRMIKLSTGNYAMVCGFNSNPNYAQLIYYFSPTGAVVQGTKFVHPQQNEIYFYDMEERANGKVVLVGAIAENPLKYLYMELSAGGVPTWQKKSIGVTPGYLDGTAYGIVKTPGGKMAIAGHSYTDNKTIAVIDSLGNGYCNAVASTLTFTTPDAYTVSNVTPIILPPNVLMGPVTNAANSLVMTTTKMCGTLDVEELIENSDALMIYPNPVAGLIHFTVGDMPFTEASVTLYNLLGERSFSVQTTTPAFDISHLPAGVYLMEVVMNDVRMVKRLVKE